MKGSDFGYQDWLKAKEVTAKWLRDLLPGVSISEQQMDGYTSTLLARLANANLIATHVDELKRAEEAEKLLQGFLGAWDADTEIFLAKYQAAEEKASQFLERK